MAYRCKNGTGQSQIVIIEQFQGGSPSYIYNFTGVNANTWTLSGEGGPSADQILTTNSVSWAIEHVIDNIPTSPSGYVTVIFASPVTAGQNCYYDTLSIKEYASVAVDPITLVSGIDIADVTNEDSLFGVEYDDPTGVATDPVRANKYYPIGVIRDTESGRVALVTDGVGFSLAKGGAFQGAPLSVGDPVVPTDVVNRENCWDIS